MIKTILTIVLTLGSFCCLFSQNEGNVIMLDKAGFLANVYNYEENPDQWVYKGKKPCIIDFYADWCGPCKKIAPILAELAITYKDQIIIYKIDTDNERELAKKFSISSIPTIMFIPINGDLQIARGAMSKENFENAIEQILLNK